MYVARDKSRYLHMFNRYPSKGDGAFWCAGVDNTLSLPKRLFPELTFENSPIEVEIIKV